MIFQFFSICIPIFEKNNHSSSIFDPGSIQKMVMPVSKSAGLPFYKT
jgi:hypothetical protein